MVDLRPLVSDSLLSGSPLCHSLGSCLDGFSPLGANAGQNFAAGFALLFLESSPWPILDVEIDQSAASFKYRGIIFIFESSTTD
jgi:hypothetical protein